MKKVLGLLAFVAALGSSVQAWAALEADPAYLRQKLTELTDLGMRKNHLERVRAREYLLNEYGRMKFATSLHEYKTQGAQNGVNVVAEKKGTESDRYFILSSHLDTVATQGADDNGSGTITAMAIAEALKDMNLRYGLRIVAFDEEEKGLVGSREYVKELKVNGGLDGLMGVINIEMTGYDSDGDGAFHVMDCDRPDSMDISRAIMDVVHRDGLALQRVSACTNRSDHANFWNAKKPAVVVSQNFFGGDGNPCYHKACDRVDQINFEYMSKITTALMRTVEGLLR